MEYLSFLGSSYRAANILETNIFKLIYKQIEYIITKDDDNSMAYESATLFNE